MYYINPDGTVGTTEVRIGEDGRLESADYSKLYSTWGTPTQQKKESKSEWSRTGRYDLVPVSSKKRFKKISKKKEFLVNEDQVKSLLNAWNSAPSGYVGYIGAKAFIRAYQRCYQKMKMFLLLSMQEKGLSVKITQADLSRICKFYCGVNEKDIVLSLFKFDSEVIENMFVKMTEGCL